MQMDEDARQHEELREQYNLQERRLSLLQTEIEEVRSGLEASERSRKLIEQELVEVTERHNELKVQVTSLHRSPQTQKKAYQYAKELLKSEQNV